MLKEQKVGSPIRSLPFSVATEEALLALSGMRRGEEIYVEETGRTRSWNDLTNSWDYKTFSLVNADPLRVYIDAKIKEGVTSVLKLVGSYTPVDSFPDTGGSGEGGAILAGNAWNIRNIGADKTIALGEHELKDGFLLYAKTDNPGQLAANWDVWESADIITANAHVYVHADVGSDEHGTGSQNYPFKTLQHALDTLGKTSVHTVFHLMSDIIEDLVINDHQNNLVYGAPAITGDPQRTITGNHLITGVNTTRIRFADLGLYGGAAAITYVVTIDGSAGRHYFENVPVIPGAAGLNQAILLTGANARWHEFYNCSIDGIFNCASSDSTMSVKITRQIASGFHLKMATSLLVNLYECQMYKYIEHESGTLIINGLYECFPEAGQNDVALLSSATELSESLLHVVNAQFIRTDASRQKINKTGDCSYILDNIIDRPSDHTLNGNRIHIPYTRLMIIAVELADWTDTGEGSFDLTINKVSVGNAHNLTAVGIMALREQEVDGLIQNYGHDKIMSSGDIYFNRVVAVAGSVAVLGY